MILIVGCGYLGSYLVKEITEKTNEPVVATVRDFRKSVPGSSAEYVYCDVTDSGSVEKLRELCSGQELTVFYLASAHNVDYVFENPEQARKINVDALESFIGAFPNISKLFYASTDCVYGEGKGRCCKFSETSPLNPVNEYGRQKTEAEKIVIEKGYTVLRFPFMLGPSLCSLPHFYDRICSWLVNGEKQQLIDGMHRSVISFSKAAELMYRLSRCENLPQIINVCGDDALTKYDVGCALARKIGVSEKSVEKISETDGEAFFKDKRASFVSMDNTLLKSLLGLTKIKWEEEIC